MAGNAHHGPGAQQVAPMPGVQRWALRGVGFFMLVCTLGLAWVIFVAPYLPKRHATDHVSSTSVTTAQVADGTGSHVPTILSSAAVVPQGPQTASYVARDPQKGDDEQPYVEVFVPPRDASGAYYLYDEDSKEEMGGYTYRCHVNTRGSLSGHWLYGTDCGKSNNDSPDMSVDKFAFIGTPGHAGTIHYRIGH